jgi:hypothetical protein
VIARGPRAHVGRPDPHGNIEGDREIRAEPRVFGRFSPEVMVEVGEDDVEARFAAQGHHGICEGHGIRTSREGHHHRLPGTRRP